MNITSESSDASLQLMEEIERDPALRGRFVATFCAISDHHSPEALGLKSIDGSLRNCVKVNGDSGHYKLTDAIPYLLEWARKVVGEIS